MKVNIFDKKSMQRFLIHKYPELSKEINDANFADLQAHCRKLKECQHHFKDFKQLAA